MMFTLKKIARYLSSVGQDEFLNAFKRIVQVAHHEEIIYEPGWDAQTN